MKKENKKETKKAVNEERPGYKHTPLGWIPEEWECLALSKITKPDRPISYGIVQTGPPVINGIKCVRVVDIKHGKIDPSNLITTTKKISDAYRRTVLQENDIVVALRGKIGELAIVASDSTGFNLTRGVAIISLKSDFESKYIYQQFTSPHSIKVLQSSLNGSALQELSIGVIRKIPILIPKTKDEQIKIATILCTWDDAINKTQQLIEQLKRRNKGLMQDLTTPKKDWHKLRIGDILKNVKRPVEWNDEVLYNLISVRRRSGGAFFRESLYGKQILTKQLYTAFEGDFLISKMQIVHGASAVVPAELSGMKISGSYISLHSKDESKLDIGFFNWLSKTRWFYRMAYISSYGVHIEKMTFDFEDFKRRYIAIPSFVKEQKRIDKILSLAEAEINILEKKLNNLRSQKKGLMQKLLTGYLRVKI